MAAVPDPASSTTPWEGTERGAGASSGRPRFGSLRARLIASHALVLVLALALVFAVSAGLLRREERRAQTERLADLAVPLLVEVRFLDRREGGAGRRLVGEALDRQAAELGVRLLVFDPDGTVRYDSGPAGGGEGLVGQRPAALVDDVRAAERAARGRQPWRRREVPARRAGQAPFAGDAVVLAADGRSPGLVLGIVAPRERRPLVGRYLPPLGLTLAGALAVAAVAGYGLSRRLAAPVTRLTAAADAMAAGELEQRVPGEGPDELGRLVASFNTMSRRVAATARSQRDLLANVAHELRTPLTSIRGYAQGLRDGVIAAPADRERALATMGSEAERMGTLIGGLLDLARLESGQARLRLAPVEVGPALERLAGRFAPEAAQREVHVTTSAPPGLRVLADEERLAQILGNLVANALGHTPAGGEVAVTAAPLAAPGGGGARAPAVRLVVRDTGAGIPPERLGRIFDRFARGPDAAGSAGGVGLGLAIVRELVAAHGGAVAVASEPGAGTTVTVDLPGVPAETDHGRRPTDGGAPRPP